MQTVPNYALINGFLPFRLQYLADHTGETVEIAVLQPLNNLNLHIDFDPTVKVGVGIAFPSLRGLRAQIGRRVWAAAAALLGSRAAGRPQAGKQAHHPVERRSRR